MEKLKVVLISLIWLLIWQSSTVSAKTKPLDRVAIIVNNGVILESEINSVMARARIQMKLSEEEIESEAELRKKVQENLILETIQLQLAAKNGVTFSDAELDEQIAAEARRAQLSIPQLWQNLRKYGIDEQSYRESVRRIYLAMKLRASQVGMRINILPREVESLAKQLAQGDREQIEVKLGHIMLSLPENPTPAQLAEQQSRGEKIMAQLRRGADFAKLALTYSNNPQTMKSEKLEWSRLEELPTLFSERLKHARKGLLVGPFRTGVGIHILFVADLRDHNAQRVVEYRCRHILLHTTELEDDQMVQTKLKGWRREIRDKRVQFSELARRYSQDKSSAAQGGDLGWHDPEIYDPEFASALRSLKENQISEPVQTEFGWHILELMGKRSVERTVDTERDRARYMLINRKRAEEEQRWLQVQRATSYVEFLGRD